MASQNSGAGRASLAAGRLVGLPDGKSYLVGATPLTIGREPSSNVPVHSEEVSRSHAYILRTPQGFLLVDSSLHGTYVNAERVQAQRILADGDVIQVGGHSFRFDLRSADPAPASPEPLETSQYATTVPTGAHATGKVRLALALTEQPSRQGRVRRWLKRYGPSEVAGIGTALGASWLVQQATGSVVAAAYGAALGEGLGFYGSLVIREMIQEAYFAGARRAPYGVSEMMRSWRGLLLEFGPAELLDTGLIRPLAMALCTTVMGWGLGIVVGKLLADVAFYLPVIWVYERRRRQP
jgi:pSer/pThr/pTyr-binding forkhead associated (FHA) protein